MSRPPSFQFYPKDWLSSKAILCMSLAQRGMYIQLLAYAWDNDPVGTLPNNPELLWRYAGAVSQKDFLEQGGECVLEQFRSAGNLLLHQRLGEEFLKQQAFRKRQSHNSRKRWPSHGNPTGEPWDDSGNALLLQSSSSTAEEDNPYTEKAQDAEYRKVIRRLFSEYLTVTNKNPKLYTLTSQRMQKGLVRLEECLAKAGGDLKKAEELMRLAIQTMAKSDFHNGKNDRGKKYLDWIDNLFKSTEKLEWWLERA